MKNFINKLKEEFIVFRAILFLIIVSPFILVLFIIKGPKDYIKYKKTRYYQDRRERYSFACGESEHIKFYDAIKEANFPIDYYRNNEVKSTGYGYFVYEDTLILCDYSDVVFFDDEEQEWYVTEKAGYSLLEKAIEEEIIKANDFLGENRCKKAVLIVEKELINEKTKTECAKFDLLPFIDGDIASSLKRLLDK